MQAVASSSLTIEILASVDADGGAQWAQWVLLGLAGAFGVAVLATVAGTVLYLVFGPFLVSLRDLVRFKYDWGYLSWIPLLGVLTFVVASAIAGTSTGITFGGLAAIVGLVIALWAYGFENGGF